MINKLYERLWMLVNVLVFKIYKFLNKVFKNNMYNNYRLEEILIFRWWFGFVY